MCHIDCNVEPLSRFGPTNVEQVCGRNDLVEGVIVDGIWLPLKFRVGSIHSLMDTKFIEVTPVGWIQFSASVILWIGVVISDSLAAQVVVSA